MRHKYSKVSDPNSFHSEPGNKFHKEFSSRFNPDGTITLVESGRTNIQAEINSHLMETDMAVIISKLQYGDTSVLNSKRPMYGDFTRFPKTYAEAFDLVNRSKGAFEALPVDIKASFDNDVAKWFSSIGTADWFRLMGFVSPDNSEKEVVE